MQPEGEEVRLRDEALGRCASEIRRLRRQLAEATARAERAEADAAKQRSRGAQHADRIAKAAADGWDACGPAEQARRVAGLCQRLGKEAALREEAEAGRAAAEAEAAGAGALRERLSKLNRRRQHLERAHHAQGRALAEAQERAKRATELSVTVGTQAELIERLQALLLRVAERAAAKEEAWEARLALLEGARRGSRDDASGRPSSGRSGASAADPASPPKQPPAPHEGAAAAPGSPAEAGPSGAKAGPARDPPGAPSSRSAASKASGPPNGADSLPAGTSDRAEDADKAQTDGEAGDEAAVARAAAAARAASLLQAREMRISLLEGQLQSNARTFAGQLAELRNKLLLMEAGGDSSDSEGDESGEED